MDPKTLIKQLIDYSKTTFDNTFNALSAVNDQTERMVNAFIDQASWFPEEGKKVIREWSKVCKKGRDDFKTTIDEGYKKVGSLFAVLEEKENKAKAK